MNGFCQHSGFKYKTCGGVYKESRKRRQVQDNLSTQEHDPFKGELRKLLDTFRVACEV